MKRAVTRKLFDYWNALRGARLAPGRDEIEPGAIRACLADTFLLPFDPLRGYPVRLAGSALCTLFGRELKGASFLALWPGNEKERLADLLRSLVREQAGLVAGATGVNAEGDRTGLELILLPLAGRGVHSARLIGALGAIDQPYWTGFRPLQGLTMTELRFVGPLADAGLPRRFVAGRDNPLRGPGFVCYPAAPRRISQIHRGHQG
jgi:hypothetical protein